MKLTVRKMAILALMSAMSILLKLTFSIYITPDLKIVFHNIPIIIVSILFAGLQNSSATVQVMGVPAQIATMMQGVIMIFVIAADFFQRYKLVIAKGGKA
jgi:riboflavin transporter FmnP